MSTAHPTLEVTLAANLEAFTTAVRGVAMSVREAFLPAFERFARWVSNSTTPEQRASLYLSAGLAGAEAEYREALNEVRHDLLRGVTWYCTRERMWAALTWGLTEQDALDRAAYMMRQRFLLDWTADEAAQIAVAILEGYSSRPEAWRRG